MCNSDEETVAHLFNDCIIWNTVLDTICEQFQIPCPSRVDLPSTFTRNWVGIYKKHSSFWFVPFHMLWNIWKARNLAIFEGKKRSVLYIVQLITLQVQTYSYRSVKVKRYRQIGAPPCLVFPCGFFDGASVKKTVGVGYSIHLNETHHYEFALGVGYGTNTKAELMGLWALLLSSQMMGIPLSHIFGDSQVIVNWAKGLTALSPPDLFHWCRETKSFPIAFRICLTFTSTENTIGLLTDYQKLLSPLLRVMVVTLNIWRIS